LSLANKRKKKGAGAGENDLFQAVFLLTLLDGCEQGLLPDCLSDEHYSEYSRLSKSPERVPVASGNGCKWQRAPDVYPALSATYILQ
jgi:hypothetical protein